MNETPGEAIPMPRLIKDHQIHSRNELLIEVIDEPGAGGASHDYRISGFDNVTNPSVPRTPEGDLAVGQYVTCILFQNGPIKESGVNGITQEALIAICIDRLRSFKCGRFDCRENAMALTKLEEALHWLHHRTRGRIHRGVEGTLTP